MSTSNFKRQKQRYFIFDIKTAKMFTWWNPDSTLFCKYENAITKDTYSDAIREKIHKTEDAFS